MRMLLSAAVATVGVVIAPPAAAQGCPPSAPPPGAASKPIGDIDLQPATLWISPDGVVGVTGFGEVEVTNAGPLPLQAFVIDAQQDGSHQLIVSNMRVAHLYVLSNCAISTVVDNQGAPFLFDLEDLRGNGTGVDCMDLGDGRHLTGLLATLSDDGWTIRRTEIDLNGSLATPGRSDTVFAKTHHESALAAASTIGCGDMTLNKDGVRQPD
jgi:hypothetical protein